MAFLTSFTVRASCSVAQDVHIHTLYHGFVLAMGE
jgi:hypothetical protein